MPDLTPELDLPTPHLTGEGANLPEAMGNQNERLEEVILAGGVRTSGKSIVAAEQETYSTSYELLGTPDRVSDIVLPTDGLIFVSYRARAMASFANSGAAAIFLDSNQVEVPFINVLVSQAAAINDAEYQWLFSNANGLSYTAASGAAPALPATGVILAGGILAIEADAGTYDVSVRVKSDDDGKFVRVKERKLRVWSMGFGFPPA